MLLHKGLTLIQSQIKLRLLFGESFTLRQESYIMLRKEVKICLFSGSYFNLGVLVEQVYTLESCTCSLPNRQAVANQRQSRAE